MEYKPQFVLGHDVFMEKVGTLCRRALIGRLEYCSLMKEGCVEWATSYWKPLIHYVPSISLLENKWLVFVFIKEPDASLILEKLWPVFYGSLVLKQSHSRFDLLTKRVTIRHLWVLLPALPFPLWNKDVLIDLANLLGWFVALERDFHLIYDKRMAKVLVEVDITKGLILELDIVCGDKVITQKLDYLHMSFRCNYCHDTGHLRNSCHRLRTGQPTKRGFTFNLFR